MAEHPNMERASKFIRALGLPPGMLSPESLACAAWAPAAGKKIAAHTRASKLVRDRLVIEVEDAVWQRQLWGLRSQIVRNLEKHIGPGLVAELEFRIVPRRIEPRRATVSTPLLAPDEASLISDPVLRNIYKASRKKALA
jgi:hypothetical protein